MSKNKEINPLVQNGQVTADSNQSRRKYSNLDANGQLLDDYGLSSRNVLGDSMNGSNQNVFTDWLFPQVKEARQNAQQLEMEKLTPSAKMEGMIAAGINPLTAAGGIASSGAPVSDPASSVNPIGDVSGAVSDLSSGFGSVASGVSTLSKLGDEKENLRYDSLSKFEAAGLSHAQAMGVMTDNKYKDEDWLATLSLKYQQYDNMKAEYHNLKAQHEEIITHIDEMISQIQLNGSQSDYFTALSDKTNEELRFLKAKHDFCLSHGLYLNESGLDGYLFSMVASGADLSKVKDFVEVYSNYRKNIAYADSIGKLTAEVEESFHKAFNEALGSKQVEAIFAPYLSNIDLVKQEALEVIKTFMANPNNPVQFVSKLVNCFTFGFAGLLGGVTDKDKIDKFENFPAVPPKRPNHQPTYKKH